MMRTSYKNHWMLAAILFCGLVMTSCSDQQGIIDNPVTPEPRNTVQNTTLTTSTVLLSEMITPKPSTVTR